MSLIRDTEEVVKFLEFAERKNLMNDHAVMCRLTACNNLFAVLNEEEDSLDYILGNLDVLIHRFRNKNENVRASTLKAYKSRVKSSIEDFKSWSADPFAWERSVTDKAKASGLGNREEKRAKRKRQEPVAQANVVVEETAVAEEVVEVTATASPTPRIDALRRVSFPIRSDFSVEISLPKDGLTLRELQRLGLFLFPYCSDIDPSRLGWPGMAPTPTPHTDA